MGAENAMGNVLGGGGNGQMYNLNTAAPVKAKGEVRLLTLTQLPQCCSIAYIPHMLQYKYENGVAGYHPCTVEELLEAETRKGNYKAFMVTLSSKQMKCGVGKQLKEAGYKLVHKCASQSYGEGAVYVWFKNLVPITVGDGLGLEVEEAGEEKEGKIKRVVKKLKKLPSHRKGSGS